MKVRSLKNQIKFYHNVTNIGLGAVTILTLIGLAIVSPLRWGEPSLAAGSTDAETTLALDTASSAAGVDLLVTSDTGTFAQSASPMEFTVSTNNYTGYTLSVKALSASTDLTNSSKDGENNTVTSSFASISGSGITAATFDSATYNGYWGFKPSYYNSSENSDKFYPSPDNVTGAVLNRTNCANGGSNGAHTCSDATDSYSIAIGARATYSQVAGEYKNSYALMAVGNFPQYTFNFVDMSSGSSTTVASKTSIQDGVNINTGISYLVPSDVTPSSITGYTFSGKWCSANNVSDITSCSGTTYKAGEDSYSLSTIDGNAVTLYAIWNINSYYLTVSAGGNVKSVTGSGTYNYGQEVTVTATPSDNTTCVSYSTNAPAWTAKKTADSNQSGYGSFKNGTASGTSVTYIMGAGNDTLTVGVAAQNLPQNITLERDSNANNITIAGTNYTSTSVSLTCGTYNISATSFGTGYEFSSWTVSGSGLALGSSGTTASNTLTVSGTGTLKLASKAKTFNLVVTGDSHLDSMTLKQGSTSGTTINGSKSGNTVTFSNLTYGVLYYLYPTFASGYKFSSWEKKDTATNAVLGSTTTENTYYKMGNGAGALTLASEASCTSTTFSGYMQSLSSTTVTNACIGDTGTLTDNRDSKTYTVAKLADGKLWMTQNLAFDAVSNKSKITTANTHVDSTSLNRFLNGGGSTSDRYAVTGLASSWTSSYSYSEPRIAVSGTCNNTYCVNNPSSGNWQSTATVTYAMGQSGTNTVGVYYNYCAATAGNYCYGSGTSYGTSSGDAEYDICPYNWRLPTGGSSGEFQALYNAYSGSTQAAGYVNALRLPLSGNFFNGKAYLQADYGYFWSSTRYDDYCMYLLLVYASGVSPASNSYRYAGVSVRCVFSPV